MTSFVVRASESYSEEIAEQDQTDRKHDDNKGGNQGEDEDAQARKQVVLDQLTIDEGIHSGGLVDSDLDLVLLCRAQSKAARAAPRWC